MKINIPKDKALHFIAGVLVAMITALAVPVISSFAFVVAFAAGLAKEVYDNFKTGLFDDKDIFATALGGIVVQIFVWLI